MSHQKPEIIINGIDIGPGYAITIMLAIEVFFSYLIKNSLGDDEHSKRMTENYLNQINNIRKIMGVIKYEEEK